MIYNAENLLKKIEEYGFLPFFKNGIPGYSVEELCPPELWFTDKEGPWEWKGPVAKSGRCIYGKFFNGKAGFVSKEWIPDFVYYRRDGYDFDARYEDGLAYYKDKDLYDTIAEHEVILSKELKKICNYCKGGNKGFDTIMTRLQMQSYICVADFVYAKDKLGNPYGWGIAQYTTPEHFFGYDFIASAYATEPAISKQKMMDRVKEVLSTASEQQIGKLLKI